MVLVATKDGESDYVSCIYSILTGNRRWIFIIEGLLTVVISCAAYFFISNYPDTAKFLSDKERSFIQARLTADSDSTRNEVFTWANVKKALFDHKCWLYGLAFHTMSLPLYTLSLFLVSTLFSAIMRLLSQYTSFKAVLDGSHHFQIDGFAFPAVEFQIAETIVDIDLELEDSTTRASI